MVFFVVLSSKYGKAFNHQRSIVKQTARLTSQRLQTQCFTCDVRLFREVSYIPTITPIVHLQICNSRLGINSSHVAIGRHNNRVGVPLCR